MGTFAVFVLVLLVVAVLLVFMGIKSVPQGREWTVERFGRYTQTLRPGLNFIIPFFGRCQLQKRAGKFRAVRLFQK